MIVMFRLALSVVIDKDSRVVSHASARQEACACLLERSRWVRDGGDANPAAVPNRGEEHYFNGWMDGEKTKDVEEGKATVVKTSMMPMGF